MKSSFMNQNAVLVVVIAVLSGLFSMACGFLLMPASAEFIVLLADGALVSTGAIKVVLLLGIYGLAKFTATVIFKAANGALIDRLKGDKT